MGELELWAEINLVSHLVEGEKNKMGEICGYLFILLIIILNHVHNTIDRFFKRLEMLFLILPREET